MIDLSLRILQFTATIFAFVILEVLHSAAIRTALEYLSLGHDQLLSSDGRKGKNSLPEDSLTLFAFSMGLTLLENFLFLFFDHFIQNARYRFDVAVRKAQIARSQSMSDGDRIRTPIVDDDQNGYLIG